MADQFNLNFDASKSPLTGLAYLRALLELAKPYNSATPRPLIILSPSENLSNLHSSNVTIRDVVLLLKEFGIDENELIAAIRNSSSTTSNSNVRKANPKHASRNFEQSGRLTRSPDLSQNLATTASSTFKPTFSTNVGTSQQSAFGNMYSYQEDNSVFEDFLNDTDFTSMASDANFGYGNPMTNNSELDQLPSSFKSNASHANMPIPPSAAMHQTYSVAPAASMLAPAAPAAPAPVTAAFNAINNRFHCTFPNCIADFGRIGDLNRHRRSHGPPTHPCTVNGCVRKGAQGFYRRDKLLSHMRQYHGMSV